MKLLTHFFMTREKKSRRQSMKEYQEEMVGRMAKEQFEKLANQGIKMPLVGI